MEAFIPYARLIDRLAFDYRYTQILFQAINHLMGWQDDGMEQITGFHKHAKAFEIKEKLENEIFDSYYKFSFVRNPFDFLVSLYFYINPSKRYRIRSKAIDMEFKDFVKWHISVNHPCQVDFITDPNDGKMLVDYIGRFETLEKDIAIIRKRLNIKTGGSVKHKNPSIHRLSKDYKVYYDQESRKLVENHYQRDLSLLGYSFNGFDEVMPIMQNFEQSAVPGDIATAAQNYQ